MGARGHPQRPTSRARAGRARCLPAIEPTPPATPAPWSPPGRWAQWMIEWSPRLACAAKNRPVMEAIGELPELAIVPDLLPVLWASPKQAARTIAGGLSSGVFGVSHRAVLVNLVARIKPASLPALGEAIGRIDPSLPTIGLAFALGRPRPPSPSDAHRTGDIVTRRTHDRPAPPTSTPESPSCGRTPSRSSRTSWPRSLLPTTASAHRAGGCRRGRWSRTCSAARCRTAR